MYLYACKDITDFQFHMNSFASDDLCIIWLFK